MLRKSSIPSPIALAVTCPPPTSYSPLFYLIWRKYEIGKSLLPLVSAPEERIRKNRWWGQKGGVWGALLGLRFCVLQHTCNRQGCSLCYLYMSSRDQTQLSTNCAFSLALPRTLEARCTSLQGSSVRVATSHYYDPRGRVGQERSVVLYADQGH